MDQNLKRNIGILKAAGFFEMNKGQVLASHDRRMAFGRKTLREHDSKWLGRKLLEAVPRGKFRFHFYSPVDPEFCRTILDEMGLSHLAALQSVTDPQRRD
jgi:hypothetical protein